MRQLDYKKLWILLLEREITKRDFREKCNISTGTITKLNQNKEVSLSILIKICNFLDCDISDICEVKNKK